MTVTKILGQVFISALTTAVLIHLATPIYIRDVIKEMECESNDYEIIHSLAPDTELPLNIPHYELHKKREEIETNYYNQIRDRNKTNHQNNLLREVLEEAVKEGIIQEIH